MLIWICFPSDIIYRPTAVGPPLESPSLIRHICLTVLSTRLLPESLPSFLIQTWSHKDDYNNRLHQFVLQTGWLSDKTDKVCPRSSNIDYFTSLNMLRSVSPIPFKGFIGLSLPCLSEIDPVITNFNHLFPTLLRHIPRSFDTFDFTLLNFGNN